MQTLVLKPTDAIVWKKMEVISASQNINDHFWIFSTMLDWIDKTVYLLPNLIVGMRKKLWYLQWLCLNASHKVPGPYFENV